MLVPFGVACAGGKATGVGSPPGTASTPPGSPSERSLQLALGAYHSCALLESGHVVCWGDNQRGQLGDGTAQPSTAPAWVPGVDDVIELRSSDAATCALRRDGSVVCWGGNAHGEAAPSANDRAQPNPSRAPGGWDRSGEPPSYAPGNVRRAPAEIGELPRARALAMGSRHGCILDEAGRVTCWGDASFGQLGPGVSDAFQRRIVAGLPPLVELSAAGVATCGRTATGDVWCWGTTGAAGAGSDGPASTPAKIFSGATRLQVFVGRTCAWNTQDEVTCWGDSGSCADTHEPSPPAPVAEYGGTSSLARAAGGCFWCLVRPTRELFCNAAPPASGSIGISAVRSVVAGNDHACAIRDDGSVWCWGANVRGELGRPTPAPRDPKPAPVEWAQARRR